MNFQPLLIPANANCLSQPRRLKDLYGIKVIIITSIEDVDTFSINFHHAWTKEGIFYESCLLKRSFQFCNLNASLPLLVSTAR
jgi:hypothetical protein